MKTELIFLSKELEKTKEDLIDLQRYLEELSNFLPLAVCTTNPLEIIIDINKAFEVLTHYTTIEIVGEPIEILFLEKKKFKEFLTKIIKEKTIYNTELTLISKEKKEISVSVSGALRKDEKGDFIGCFFAITNITELKELQENLEKKVKERTKELEESKAALEEAKAVLEIKVQARTKELRELAEGLEVEVERRTKEVRERMEELEKFHRLAVGRELKMIELKKEIERLKRELKESKK
ncbi:MAG: PAS domain-containing protein [Patescibacteria group bacterium]|nr:PAS domain-containing protein [Patescibacteria group bacterium]